MKNFVVSFVLIAVAVLVSTGANVDAQNLDWPTFENYVFGVAGEVVQQGTTSPQKVNEINQYMTAFMTQGKCPTLSACESLSYIIATISSLTNGMGDRDQQIAVLRQAVHQYTSNAQRAQSTSHTTPANQTAANTPKMLNFDLSYAYRPGGKGEFKQLAEGAQLRSGDHYKILFRATVDCFVYLFQQDSSGRIYGLFPLQSFHGTQVNLKNPVKGGQLYYLPAKDKSFKLDKQTGQERLYFLASRQRDTALEQEYLQLLKVQDQGSPQEMLTAQKSFTRALSQKGPAAIVTDTQRPQAASWQEGGQRFSIISQRLAGACESCINVLTFMHQ